MVENEETAAQSVEEVLQFEVDDEGRYRAVLPSGKRPVIKPVHPMKLRRIFGAYPEPKPATVLLEVPGSGMAQRVPDDNNPEYQKKRAAWFMELQRALLTRYITEALVVPEDADIEWEGKQLTAMPDCPLHWSQGSLVRWKRMGFTEEQVLEMRLEVQEGPGACTCVPPEDDWSAVLRMTGVQVPENGIDRQWAYAEEALEAVFYDMGEQVAFTAAVRSISIPTEAGIEAARRRFRDQMARAIAAGNETTSGEDQSGAGT